MKTLYPIILVFFGGGLGASLRYGVNQLVFGSAFPLSTLLVNIMGSLALGVLWSYSRALALPPGLMLFFGVGVLGGFTTFSGFSLESIRLFEDKQNAFLMVSLLGNNVLGLAFCALGLWIGKQMSL